MEGDQPNGKEGPSDRATILLVDDEERVLFVLRSALAKLDNEVEVMTANSARGALETIRDRRVDLVITDLIMPDMDGIQFTERIVGTDGCPIVVWMTAYGCHSFKKQGERLGIERCVEKPLEIDQVRRIALEALAQEGLSNR